MSEPLIRVSKLVKDFKTYDRRPGLTGAMLDLFHREYKTLRAVNEVSFQIERGEMVGYIGANGAGKSTTLKILCGILFPTSGECTVDGRVPWKNREAHVQRIGAVFGQRSQLWWDLAAGESLRLIGRIYGVPDDKVRERIDEFDRILDIGEFLKTPVRKLSLGQKMRCELAASLIHEPQIVFLDEPTIGLDVVAKQAIREFLRRINRERGVTMILTTHDLREIEELCKRVLIIDKGKLVFDGTLEGLRAEAVDTVELHFRLSHTLSAEWKPDGLPVRGIEWKPAGAELVARLSRTAPTRAEVIRAALEHFGAALLDIAIEEPQIEAIVQRIYKASAESTSLNFDGVAKLAREARTNAENR
ncbi:MAG: ATP-binding cassette domain-containing protein [Planctomycetes bacterium]|nr:ATP-binding cassette domain-containing protein [Planctomycetota bacterium]